MNRPMNAPMTDTEYKNYQKAIREINSMIYRENATDNEIKQKYKSNRPYYRLVPIVDYSMESIMDAYHDCKQSECY